MEDDLKKIGRRSKKKNGKQPWKEKEKNILTSSKKMEDDLKKRRRKKGRRPKNKKIEDDLKQNGIQTNQPKQPNWLWHHCKFT